MKKRNTLLLLLAATSLAACGPTGSSSKPASSDPVESSEPAPAESSEQEATSQDTSEVKTDASSSEEVVTPKYKSLVDYNYNTAVARYDMHDLYVNLSAANEYLGGMSLKKYDETYADYEVFNYTTYRAYDSTKDTGAEKLYFNIAAKLSVLGGYSVGNYALWYAETAYTALKEAYGEEYFLITEDNIANVKACVASISGWTEADYVYCSFVAESGSYLDDIEELVADKKDEEGYAPVTREVRTLLQNISAAMFRGSTAYYYYFTYVLSSYVSGETAYTDGYEPLCDSNGGTKDCAEDAKVYISTDAKYEFLWDTAKKYTLFSNTDMATYVTWYPNYFQTVGHDYYQDLLDAIGDTADADGWAPVTDAIKNALEDCAYMLGWGDYGTNAPYFCFVKDGDTYTQWDDTKSTDNLYFNVNAKNSWLAYGATEYSVADYQYSFQTVGRDLYGELTALIEPNLDEYGYAEVVDGGEIEEILKLLSVNLWGSEDYYYELLFVKSVDVAK